VSRRFFFFLPIRVFFRSSRAASVAILPSALFLLSDFRSVQVGRPRFSRCCYLISTSAPLSLTEAGPGLSRSHLNSAVELDSSPPTLGHRAHHFVVVPQWLVDLPAYPQLVKEYGQLPSHRNHSSFFGILSSALG
jgi:hypothetical protein